ncbi:hypothetical protein EYF80_041981 [Liparis tanakae]|uniref:Uncharacterized protein n=1 Tax=Liparis tanakae TaxID=230148 RepID=A0A4Z2G2V3_9TELE|nr:hypothetical protein EYF80_041981 [Liparis tanakae]
MQQTGGLEAGSSPRGSWISLGLQNKPQVVCLSASGSLRRTPRRENVSPAAPCSLGSVRHPAADGAPLLLGARTDAYPVHGSWGTGGRRPPRRLSACRFRLVVPASPAASGGLIPGDGDSRVNVQDLL